MHNTQCGSTLHPNDIWQDITIKHEPSFMKFTKYLKINIHSQESNNWLLQNYTNKWRHEPIQSNSANNMT